MKNTAIAISGWGVFGVLMLFARAVWRLTPFAVEPLKTGSLSATQGAIYVGWIAFSLYFEGYRAFQKQFCPRVVARALHLGRYPHPLHVVLAPAYCLGLFYATKKRIAIAWASATIIVVFVVTLRHVPQPWRGIVDGGVVLALLWGIVAIVFYFVRALRGLPIPASPEVPSYSPGRE